MLERRKRRHIGTTGFAVLCACLCLGCITFVEPSPQVSPISVLNSMDYWTQQSVGDVVTSLITDMETNSNTALASAAGINFAWEPRDQNLPPLNPGQPDQWPVFSQNPQFYYTYVSNQYPPSGQTPGAFRTFFVSHLQGNPDGSSCPTGPSQFVAGTSTYLSPNQIDSSEPLNRMTFLYLEDIFLIGSACINSGQLINTVITSSALLTHELGHQRAGLTHSSGDQAMPQYHQGIYGNVPANKFDVMSTQKSLVDLTSNGPPEFDKLDYYPHNGDNTTCQGNLAHWKTITN